MIIKVLLVASMALLAVVALRGSPSPQSLALRRLGFLAVLAFGVVAIVIPSLVTWLANAVGVGRGTDLLLYVLTVAFLLVSFRLYQRLSALERRYVELARRVAISEASAPPESAVPRDPVSGARPALPTERQSSGDAELQRSGLTR